VVMSIQAYAAREATRHCTGPGIQPRTAHRPLHSICNMVLASFSCRGRHNSNFGALVGAALCTLPEPDQQAAIQAEVESGSWAHYVHAHPDQIYSSYCSLDCFFSNLRLIVLTAAFSHFAYNTVLDHLGGRLPMDDWEELEQVGTKQCEGNKP